MSAYNLELPAHPGGAVRVVGVIARCGNCHREHRVAVDPDGRVPVEALACGDPRCVTQQPRPRAA